MKKRLIMIALVCGLVVAPMVGTRSEAKDAAAGVMSAVLPGAGEWYNSNWNGSFPWGECIVGYICFFFRISSMFDAANGNTDANLRFDFWSAPSK